MKCKDQRTNLVIRCRSSLLYSLRHRDVGREEHAGVPYDRNIDKCKDKLSKDSRYWPNEAKQDLKMAPQGPAQKWIDVMTKGSGNKVATLLETR